MSVVSLSNLDKFDASVQLWFQNVKRAAEEVAVGLAKQVFDRVLIESPQYSGDFTANWKVSVGTPDKSFTIGVIAPKLKHPDTEGIRHVDPFKRGDPEAIAYAKSHAHWQPINLGQKIFISNSADHDQPYAMLIEEGAIKFRPVNRGADYVGRRSVEHVSNRYRQIGAGQLAILRRIGA